VPCIECDELVFLPPTHMLGKERIVCIIHSYSIVLVYTYLAHSSFSVISSRAAVPNTVVPEELVFLPRCMFSAGHLQGIIKLRDIRGGAGGDEGTLNIWRPGLQVIIDYF